MTPFFKQQNKSKAVSIENVSLNTAFRPIETSRSTEDIQEILKTDSDVCIENFPRAANEVGIQAFRSFSNEIFGRFIDDKH
jgi:hypothetical protein